MKNYYDQLHELNIARSRLKSLKQKKDLYFNMTQPGGISYDGERVIGGIIVNAVDKYVEKIEDIDVQIKLIEAEIIILQEDLKDMEKALRHMSGTLVKIFVMRYIDGLSINQICKKINYSRPQVYRKLQKIRKIIKDETK